MESLNIDSSSFLPFQLTVKTDQPCNMNTNVHQLKGFLIAKQILVVSMLAWGSMYKFYKL